MKIKAAVVEEVGAPFEIKDNIDKLKGKVILDTRMVCNLEGTYRL